MFAKQELLKQRKEKKEQLQKYKAKKAEKEPVTTMKRIVAFCLINGFCWVWCSYILAFMGRYEIAESLSKVAITEIIGVVLVYAVKSLFENLSRFNSWPDKPGTIPVEEMKTEEVLDLPVAPSGEEDMSDDERI